MDIENRAEELARLMAGNVVPVRRAKEAILSLIREAVAEAVAENDREWQKTYDEAVNNPPGYLIKVVDASKEVRGG